MVDVDLTLTPTVELDGNVDDDPPLTLQIWSGVHGEGWRETGLALPDGAWRDELSGAVHRSAVPLRALWAALPIALLVRG